MRSRGRGVRLAGATLAAAALVVSCSSAGRTPATSPSAALPGSPTATVGTPTSAPAHPSGPCGWPNAAPVKHVVWIWMENRTYDELLHSARQAPRLSSYARACGLATDYSAITHPSLPNYLAATSGSTGGVTSDCSPSSCPQNRASLFGQIDAAGLQWRTYAEAMPTPCNRVSQGRYATKHNPAVYFTPIRSRCKTWDLPMGGASGAFAAALTTGLPAFTFVEPDICDDGHDCSTRVADNWLGSTLDPIIRSPSYQRGDVAVFVTWDEGIGDDQHVATVVISPGVPRGTFSAAQFTHYSLLRTTETLLGLAPLGAAADAADMAAAFGLR